MRGYRIGEVARALGLSVDTLRYYERIGLLPRVARDPSGLRVYGDADLSRLRFIQRTQTMNFTLAEIGALLRMRDDPAQTRSEVRELTRQKLAEIDARLASLQSLRSELRELVDLCARSEEGCPILDELAHKRGRQI